jgi:L-amino acid N-acyltransferase
MYSVIRNAGKEDLSAIKELYNYYILNTQAVYDEQPKSEADMENWFTHKMSLNFPVLVLEVDGVFAGYGSFGQFRPFEGFRFCVEHSLYLKNEFKGLGLGVKLLNALIIAAKNKNMRSMVAGIDAANNASIQLHLKVGFEEIGTFKNSGYKNEKWLDLTMLQLQLDVVNDLNEKE